MSVCLWTNLWRKGRCCRWKMLWIHTGMLGKGSSRGTAAGRCPPGSDKATGELKVTREVQNNHRRCFAPSGCETLSGCVYAFTSQQLCYDEVWEEAQDGYQYTQSSVAVPLNPTHWFQTALQLQKTICEDKPLQLKQ